MSFDGVILVYSAHVSSYVWVEFIFYGNLVCSKLWVSWPAPGMTLFQVHFLV